VYIFVMEEPRSLTHKGNKGINGGKGWGKVNHFHFFLGNFAIESSREFEKLEKTACQSVIIGIAEKFTK